MPAILMVVQLLCALVAIGCCIFVWVKMFQHGETTRGIIFIATTPLCGVGVLLTLLYGIRKQKEWGISKVLNAWGIAIVVNILIVLAQAVLGPR